MAERARYNREKAEKNPGPRGSGAERNHFPGLKPSFRLTARLNTNAPGLGVLGVGAEIAQAEELEPVGRLGGGQRGLQLAALQHLQRAGVQAVQEVLVPAVWILVSKEVIVQPDLSVHGGGGVHPVDGSPFTFRPSAGFPPELSGS